MTLSIINALNVPADFQEKKQLLNEEFNRSAKIQDIVSYIYYPAPSEFPILGHAELEIEGVSWTILSSSFSKPLSKMIVSSQEGRGSPFFRFTIPVSPDKLNTLRNNVEKVHGLTCSDGVSQALSKYGNFGVLFPFSISPLASALYLTASRMLDSSRVKKIEFYGGQKPLVNVARCFPGSAFEAVYISLVVGFLLKLQ